MPKISVVMPVYNGEKYLRETIDSILNQSFKDFEFIIINDGSTDDTEEVIKSYRDKHLIYIKNSSNKGLSVSFNIGIRIARGQYIARMDADDISFPERFHTQFMFLENNPQIRIIGSSVILINKDGKHIKKHSRPVRHIDIKWTSLFSTPLIHPTVMARSEVLKENPYDESMSNSEDYELWSRLLFERNVIFANIREPLLYYRVFTNSFTRKLDYEKRVNSAQNSIRNIERYIEMSEAEKELVVELRQEKSLSSSQLMSIWYLYKRAAAEFSYVEKLGIREMIKVHSKLFSLAIFLAKHKIKRLLSPA